MNEASTMPRAMLEWRRASLVLAVILAYSAFAGIKALDRDGFSAFIVAGDHFVDRTRLDQPIAVLPHSAGYDGQFFYRLALDPITHRKVDRGITLDRPSQRMQRIGYPLLAHILSFGDRTLTPFVLVALNLAGLGLLCWAATGIATLFGRPAWQGLIIPLYPGLLLSLSRDTAEIVAAAFATLAVHAALRSHSWRAGLLGCAAALTRETTLFYLTGFGMVAAFAAVRERRWDSRVGAFLLPVAALAIWQAVLIATWKQTSFGDVGNDDFGWPLIDLATAFHRDVVALGEPHFPFMQLYSPLTKVFVIAQAALVGVALARRRALDWRLAAPWLLYVTMAGLFTDAIWVEPFGYLRVIVDLYVVGCIVLLSLPAERIVKGLVVAAPIIWAAGWPYAL